MSRLAIEMDKSFSPGYYYIDELRLEDMRYKEFPISKFIKLKEKKIRNKNKWISI